MSKTIIASILIACFAAIASAAASGSLDLTTLQITKFKQDVNRSGLSAGPNASRDCRTITDRDGDDDDDRDGREHDDDDHRDGRDHDDDDHRGESGERRS